MIRHVALSVRGTLLHTDRELKRMAPSITVDGKRLQTAQEVREMLMEELAHGHELLPMCECDNFDYKTGCGGHPSPSDTKEER